MPYTSNSGRSVCGGETRTVTPEVAFYLLDIVSLNLLSEVTCECTKYFKSQQYLTWLKYFSIFLQTQVFYPTNIFTMG